MYYLITESVTSPEAMRLWRHYEPEDCNIIPFYSRGKQMFQIGLPIRQKEEMRRLK